MVTGNPYRSPALLANMAATFDHFSGGRLDLGIGAGWHEAEANAYGNPLLPIGKRLDQFEEACEIVDALLTRESTDFKGAHYTLHDAHCEPKPLQKPRPPLVMGGVGEKRFRESRRDLRTTGITRAARPRTFATSSKCCTGTVRPWGAIRRRSLRPAISSWRRIRLRPQPTLRPLRQQAQSISVCTSWTTPARS